MTGVALSKIMVFHSNDGKIQIFILRKRFPEKVFCLFIAPSRITINMRGLSEKSTLKLI